MWAAYIKEEMSIFAVYVPSPYNVFPYFLEEQVHKDNKLGIKELWLMWVKVG